MRLVPNRSLYIHSLNRKGDCDVVGECCYLSRGGEDNCSTDIDRVAAVGGRSFSKIINQGDELFSSINVLPRHDISGAERIKEGTDSLLFHILFGEQIVDQYGLVMIP